LSTATPWIAVTGATGFIGRTLCAHLQANGYSVRALVRNADAATSLAASGVTPIIGDLSREDSLSALLDDAAAVIHLAGAVRGSSPESFKRTNVDGTQRLIDVASRSAHPPKLIYISSLAAREPQLSWYARSKHTAEQRLQATTERLDWAIIRPPAVYGPGDKEMLAVFRSMARGVLPIPGDPASRVSLIHVDDLVEGIIACLRLPKLGRRTFALDDGMPDGYGWLDMAAIAEGVWGRKVHPLRVPALLLDGLAYANLGLSRLLGYAPMLTPSKLRELRHPDWVVNNQAFTEATGWHPQVTLRSGLEKLKRSIG
jgi:nucleoside-diphosphate-sugar epimerase